MKNEILQLEEELRLAMINSDVQKLDELIADTLIFTSPFGLVVNKQMDLEGHRTRIQKITNLTPSEQKIEVYGDSAAVTVKMELAGTYNEMDISGVYRYIRVWKKIGDKFQIIAGSVVQLPTQFV